MDEKCFIASFYWKYKNGELNGWGEQKAVVGNSRKEVQKKLRELYPYDRSKREPSIFVSKWSIELIK